MISPSTPPGAEIVYIGPHRESILPDLVVNKMYFLKRICNDIEEGPSAPFGVEVFGIDHTIADRDNYLWCYDLDQFRYPLTDEPDCVDRKDEQELVRII